METSQINLAAIPDQVIKVITTPVAFFRSMAKTGGLLDPLIFVIVIAVVNGLLQSLGFFIGVHPMFGAGMAFASIIIVPIFAAIFSFIGAGILYVIWRLMGSTQNYETAYRCLAYASAITPITTLLGFVPYLNLLGLVWMLYLLVIASVEVHGIAAKTAWIVFGILTALLALFQISAYQTARQMGQSGEAMQRNMGEFSKQMEQMQKQIEEEMKKHPPQPEQQTE
jgi:hypothetical protein